MADPTDPHSDLSGCLPGMGLILGLVKLWTEGGCVLSLTTSYIYKVISPHLLGLRPCSCSEVYQFTREFTAYIRTLPRASVLSNSR